MNGKLKYAENPDEPIIEFPDVVASFALLCGPGASGIEGQLFRADYGQITGKA